jgi:hypothetical protein
MLDIIVNLDTGVAALVRTTAIKAGGGIPVRLVFSRSPGASPAIELALSPTSGTPTVLAYLNDFHKQNERTFFGALNTLDSRLLDYLAGLTTNTATVDVELVVTVDETPQPFPNFSATVQKPVISGPVGAATGPVYPFFLITAKDNPDVVMKVEVLSNSQFEANPYTP